MNDNLFELLFGGADSLSDTLLVSPDGTEWCYADCRNRAGQFANALVGLGVTPGDRVAVQVEKSVDALALYLGCLRMGAAFLPLNTAYTVSEVEYFLGDAEPALVVCPPESHSALDAVSKKVGAGPVHSLGTRADGTLAQLADQSSTEFETVLRAGDDLAAILYTSGTTGRSKGAMLTHANLAANAKALVSYWGFTREDRLIHALPIFHAHGLFVAIHVTMLAGASMIFQPGFDADDVMAAFPGATSMMGVPTFYTRLLARDDFERALVSHMRLFVSGSAPLSAEVHKTFEARTGHAILERYGMTETGMNTSNPLDGDRRPGTVGYPLPGVEIRIADLDSGTLLPQGEVGVIEIRGANVFKGYWRMPVKTASEFRDDGFFISGDLGFIDEDGYVHIAGRGKDLIISGGFNVYPAEVEAELDQIDGVAESAVIGAPHSDFGEGVTAVVALDHGASVTEDAIREALSVRLANYKVPKRVFFVEALPRNTMGKIEKARLRAIYSDAYIGA